MYTYICAFVHGRTLAFVYTVKKFVALSSVTIFYIDSKVFEFLILMWLLPRQAVDRRSRELDLCFSQTHLGYVRIVDSLLTSHSTL